MFPLGLGQSDGVKQACHRLAAAVFLITVLTPAAWAQKKILRRKSLLELPAYRWRSFL